MDIINSLGIAGVATTGENQIVKQLTTDTKEG